MFYTIKIVVVAKKTYRKKRKEKVNKEGYFIFKSTWVSSLPYRTMILV